MSTGTSRIDRIRDRGSRSDALAKDNIPSHTIAVEGKPIPIVYGTMKVPVCLIEKSSPTLIAPAGAVPLWATGHLYFIDDIVDAGADALHLDTFICIASGTSSGTGTGPAKPASPAPGTDITDGSVHWAWMGSHMPVSTPTNRQHFLGALCEGEITGFYNLYCDQQIIPTGSATGFAAKGLTVKPGVDAGTQVLPSPYNVTGSYQHTAVIYSTVNNCDTGTQSELPALAVEVKGITFDAISATNYDDNPADIVTDILTHGRRGCGLSSAMVDASVTGNTATSWRTFCNASGLRVSMLIDTQRPAADIITDLGNATLTDLYWSQGVLKARPWWDQPITSPVYGATSYVPVTTPVATLTPDDFLGTDKPVTVTRRADADCYNAFPISFFSRHYGYRKMCVEDQELDDAIVRNGLRRAPVTDLDICTDAGASMIAMSRVLCQRSLMIRNEFVFRVGFKWLLLEPTDIVALTEPAIGLSAYPVWITKIQEEEDGITVTAWDYPSGASSAVAYLPDVGSGMVVNQVKTTQNITMDRVIDGPSTTWAKIAGVSSANQTQAPSYGAATIGALHTLSLDKRSALTKNVNGMHRSKG
jgi:hypothetical protein